MGTLGAQFVVLSVPVTAVAANRQATAGEAGCGLFG